MIIHYPTAHKWIKKINDDPFKGFGKNHLSRLKNTLKKLPRSTVTYSYEPLTLEILNWFNPIYKTTIEGKNSPNIKDIYSNTLGKETKFNYYALILKEAGKNIGAVIYSERNKTLSFAYRVFPNSWTENSLPAGPSLLAEYLMNLHATINNFKTIAHGRDRNPYGINANIGLALFKLSIGCKVYLPKNSFELDIMDTDQIQSDVLIFESPKDDNKQITQCYLIVKNESLLKFDSILKYDHLIKTTVLLRD